MFPKYHLSNCEITFKEQHGCLLVWFTIWKLVTVRPFTNPIDIQKCIFVKAGTEASSGIEFLPAERKAEINQTQASLKSALSFMCRKLRQKGGMGVGGVTTNSVSNSPACHVLMLLCHGRFKSEIMKLLTLVSVLVAVLIIQMHTYKPWFQAVTLYIFTVNCFEYFCFTLSGLEHNLKRLVRLGSLYFPESRDVAVLFCAFTVR